MVGSVVIQLYADESTPSVDRALIWYTELIKYLELEGWAELPKIKDSIRGENKNK